MDGAALVDDRIGGEILSDRSMEEILRAHSAAVYRLAYRLTGNPHDAADLTQDVFVRVLRFSPTFRAANGTLSGWIHRITTNLFLDRVRRERRIRFEAFGDGAGELLASHEPTPAQVLCMRAFDDDVRAALDGLPQGFRNAVVLYDIEGLSYAEIAMTLGIEVGTARTRVCRGRARLRTALASRAPRPTGMAVTRPIPGPRRDQWSSSPDSA